MLTSLIKKNFPKFRHYYRALRVFAVTTLVATWMGSYGCNFAINGSTAESRVKQARAEGKRVELTSEGTPFNDTASAHLRMYEPKVDGTGGGYTTIYNPYKRWDIYVHLMFLWSLNAVFRYYSKSRFKPKLSRRESSIKTLVQGGVVLGSLAYCRNAFSSLNILPAIEMIGIVTPALWILPEMYYHKHLITTRYRHAVESGDTSSNDYMFGRFFELQAGIRQAFKKGNQLAVWELLLEQVRLLRGISPENRRKLGDDKLDLSGSYGYIASRIKAKCQPSVENDLRLTIMNSAAQHTALELDLEDAVQRNPGSEVEFRILDYELCTTEERRRKAIELYRLLEQRRQIEPATEGKKSVVGIMNCNALRRQYVVKRSDLESVVQEGRQTQYIEEGLRDEEGVISAAVKEVFDKSVLEHLENDGVIMLSYIQGTLLSKILHNGLSVEDKVGLLIQAAQANAKTCDMGIDTTVEDRLEKAVADIEGNERLPDDLRRMLVDNIGIVLLYSDAFPSVYDRDGTTDNVLVCSRSDIGFGEEQNRTDIGEDKNHKRVIGLIDLEARRQSDPTYMIIKLLEHKTALGYDESGTSARNRVIGAHFECAPCEDRELIMPHYYASIILKALSYDNFTQARQDCDEIRQGYYRSAVYGLNTVLRLFGNRFHGATNVRKLESVRDAVIRLAA